jgi:hypothetical protein
VGQGPGTSGPRFLLSQEAAVGLFGHSEQRLWLFKKGRELQFLRLGSALWLLWGSSGGRYANLLQPALPLGPGPEALPRPEPVHGQPGHVQQRTSQLLPLLEENRAGDTDDGEARAVTGLEWVQTEPCASEASTTHFMGEMGGGREEANRACYMLPPQGIHQGRTPRLPENTHSEESHVGLHIPGVSFPASLCTEWACGSVWGCIECIIDQKSSERNGSWTIHVGPVVSRAGLGGGQAGEDVRETLIGALNLLLSNLEPALEEQTQADVVHSCLHSVMALPPEAEGGDGVGREVLHGQGWQPGGGGAGAGQGVRSASERSGITHGSGGLALPAASVSGHGVCP